MVFLLLLALLGVSTVVYAQDPVPPKGLHLAEEDAAIHFGPNFECMLGFDAGPPPKIVASCPVEQPPPPPPSPQTPPPSTPPVPSRIVVLGGKVGCTNNELNTNDDAAMIFDTVTSAWTAITKPSWSGNQMRLAYVNGLVYSIGGAHTNKVQRYNPADDASGWTEVANMAKQRSDSSVVVHDGKIYALGGYNAGISDCEYSGEVYDPTADSWSSIATMPAQVCGHTGAFSVGGYIYNTGWPNKLIRYDPASDSWATMASMSASNRGGQGGAAINGLLYAATGAGQSVERYDPSTDQWTSVADYPSGHDPTAAHQLAVGGKLYVMGGGPDNRQSPACNEANSMNRYDPATDTWSALPDMPYQRRYFAAVAII